MSPTTSTPVFRISAVIAVTYLDSDPAGCTTLVASLSFISCSGLRCDCGELIIFSTLGSAFDPAHTIPHSRLMHVIEGALRKSDRPATDVRQIGATDAPATRLLTRQVLVTHLSCTLRRADGF